MKKKSSRNKLLVIAVALIQLLLGEAVTAYDDGLGKLHLTVKLDGQIRGASFVVAPGLVATSAHVLGGRAPGAVVTLRRIDGTNISGRLIGRSDRIDMAVIAVNPDIVPDAPVRADAVHKGMRVTAAIMRDDALVAFRGDVTRPRHAIAAYGSGFVATIPGIGPGFSGGPVVNAAGRVVGMVAAYRRLPPPVPASAFAPAAARTALPSASAEAFVLDASIVVAEADRMVADAR